MVKKILLKPYKAHRHLSRGTATDKKRYIQYSYKGVALTRFEQRLARRFNQLIDELRSEGVLNER